MFLLFQKAIPLAKLFSGARYSNLLLLCIKDTEYKRVFEGVISSFRRGGGETEDMHLGSLTDFTWWPTIPDANSVPRKA